jgi:hypothetical protein
MAPNLAASQHQLIRDMILGGYLKQGCSSQEPAPGVDQGTRLTPVVRSIVEGWWVISDYVGPDKMHS